MGPLDSRPPATANTRNPADAIGFSTHRARSLPVT